MLANEEEVLAPVYYILGGTKSLRVIETGISSSLMGQGHLAHM